MNPRESSLWEWLKTGLKRVQSLQEHSMHWTRIESSTGEGIPDVELCVDGPTAWIELKIGDMTPDGLKADISKEQFVWHTLRLKAGGLAYFLVRYGRNLWLMKGSHAARQLMTGTFDPSNHFFRIENAEDIVLEVQRAAREMWTR